MRLSSLGDIRRKQEEEEKKEGRPQEYFTGGIDQRGGGSGLAVQDPPDPDDLFGRIVQRAQQNLNSEQAEPSSAAVGSDTNSTRITLWANGFQVNGGEFRSDADPNNRQFLATLAAGFVPDELREGAKDLSVGLEDRRTEQFNAPPPPRYIAFGGDGVSLGSTTAAGLIIHPAEMSHPAPHVDDTHPTTIIQVKLTDGKKLKIKINQSSSVSDLVTTIIRDGNISYSFSMSAGFPPKDITNLIETIKEAGLVGASVMLKGV